MLQNRRKLILFAVVGLLGIGIVFYVIAYFVSTRTVAVVSKNIASYGISEQNAKSGKQMAASKTSVRVKKDKTYALSYVGVSDYASGTITITPTTDSVTIDPDYSAEKLNTMLDLEISAINSAIVSSGTSIDTLYTIQRGTLSHFGEWYFTTLTYKGSADDESSDTLVVGLQKIQGIWTATLSPDIIFTTAAYPKVARDFIDAANAYQSTHVIPVEESYYR